MSLPSQCHFRGLRAFKETFNSECLMADVSALVAGGYLQVFRT